MKSFWINMLLVAIKGLIGSLDWKRILDAVGFYFDSTISGEERRILVITLLKEQGVRLENFLINLAIEIAVAKLKNL